MKQRNVLVTGGSGMIGTAISEALIDAGYNVYQLKRDSTDAPFHYLQADDQIYLNPAIPLYAVINLAGPNISDRRWTVERKRYLLTARQRLTHSLAVALAELPIKPRLFLSASAIGYYGLTGENTVDEDSPAGEDFLADVAKQWEQATSPSERAGINTIHLRLGVVLSRRGGMLKKLLLPFELGLGGRVGNGKQFLSWISIFDVVHVVLFLLESNPKIPALNLVADQAVRNADFSSQLGRLMNRPSFLPLPAFMVKILFGEMGEVLLLGSVRVKSVKLQSLGIKLKHPTIDSALSAVLADKSSLANAT